MLILLISVCAFLIRLIQPIDTSILNMQLCFFSQYIIYFIIGIISYRYKWFSMYDYKYGKRWLLSDLIPGFIFWVIIMMTGGALQGGLNLYKGGGYTGRVQFMQFGNPSLVYLWLLGYLPYLGKNSTNKIA